MGIFRPLVTGEGRVFVNEAGVSCHDGYSYHNCMSIEGVEESFGDVTPIYCPSDSEYDEFVEVGFVKGAETRPTSSMIGRLPATVESVLESVKRRKATFDMQVHYGLCSRPDDFNTFDSAFVFRNVKLTNYSTDKLVALGPDERAVISETASISIGSVYRVFSLTFNEVALAYTSNKIVNNLVWCNDPNCETDDVVKECNIAIALSITSSNNPYFLYSLDSGITWQQVAISLPGTTSDLVTSMVYYNDDIYLSVLTATGSDIYVATVSSIISGLPSITLSRNETVANHYIRDATQTRNFVFFAGGQFTGYILSLNKSTGQYTILEDGVIQPITGFNAITSYDDNNVLAGGGLGRYTYSNTYGIFQSGQISIDGVLSTATIYDLYMFSPSRWLALTGDGLMCTQNSGINWSVVVSATGLSSIGLYDGISGYLLGSGGIYRTMSGGNSIKLIDSPSLPGINQSTVSICPYNPNLVLISGGSSSNGFIVRGSNN